MAEKWVLGEELSQEEIDGMFYAITFGFTNYCDIKGVEFKRGICTCEIELQEHHLNPSGIVHGGVFFTLSDVVAGLAARTMASSSVSTMDSYVSYMSPGIGCTKVIGTATVLKAGKRTITVETVITNDSGKMLSKVMTTYFVIDKNTDLKPPTKQ